MKTTQMSRPTILTSRMYLQVAINRFITSGPSWLIRLADAVYQCCRPIWLPDPVLWRLCTGRVRIPIVITDFSRSSGTLCRTTWCARSPTSWASPTSRLSSATPSTGPCFRPSACRSSSSCRLRLAFNLNSGQRRSTTLRPIGLRVEVKWTQLGSFWISTLS